MHGTDIQLVLEASNVVNVATVSAASTRTLSRFAILEIELLVNTAKNIKKIPI